MICPNCGKEMKVHEKRERVYYGYGADYYDSDNEDWNDDYVDEYKIIRTFSCKNCKIKYNENDDEWNIPKEMAPTEKQVKAGLFIANHLKIDLPPPHKKSYWKFINEKLKDAIVVHEQIIEDYYYDNYQWLEEEF